MKSIFYYIGLIYTLGVGFNLLISLFHIVKNKTKNNKINIRKEELVNALILVLSSFIYWIIEKRFTLLR